MGSSNYMAFLAIALIILPMTSMMADAFNFTARLCEEVNCGKGTCKADMEYPFGFACECENGWKRTRDNDDDLTWLPCVIPNCSLNYNCQPAPPPVPAKQFPYNTSAFDPCYWVYCGEGKCIQNQTYTHTCECNSGSSNLLNITQFPCYNECTLGSDCAKLGIKVSNSTANNSDNGTGQGTSILPGKYTQIAILIMSAVMMLWQ